MAREYEFVFSGTKEAFFEQLALLSPFPNDTFSDGKFYYFEDYIVRLVADKLHFGVARGGHSGGYWFIPTVTDLGDRIEFRGTIEHIGSNDPQSPFNKAINRIAEILCFIILLPLILLVKIYLFLEWIVRKLCNRPKPKEITPEDRLFDLMENYFHCIPKHDPRAEE